ncbi:MAG: hypothetical protein HUU26_04250 [Gemmatimonadaceae bacterium]|nr:hypothetical protein [Gemmatimonadaceae bacterium]
MLVNLLPDFLEVLNSSDRVAAYHRYYDAHRHRLAAYWHNYVFDPDTAHFADVVRMAALADRSDLLAMLERTDVVALARSAEAQCAALLESDVDIDVMLMVGVGAANAGELVVAGRGIAFVCLEHFTGVQNHETQGLGLDPELIPMWLAHEMAHAVRYTSPRSRSEIRQVIEESDGYYSYWETGRGATLGEHVVNEGIAVEVSRLVSPGHAAWEYFGYARRQFARIRELESVVTRAILADFDGAALGLRLRYLSGGVSDEARAIDRTVVPERAGYFVGSRLVAPAIEMRGPAWAVRAGAHEIIDLSASSVATASA